MHKTGTTSIQNSLLGYEDSRFLYADILGSPNHSIPIYSIFAFYPEKHASHRQNRWDARQLTNYIARSKKDLQCSIESVGSRTLIISGEDIGVLSRGELSRFREYLGKWFDEVDVVGYVRSPVEYMASAFQQRVKGATVHSFNLDSEYRNYELSFKKFDEVFGQKNVLLKSFNPQVFPSRCVVRDFCELVGVDLPINKIVKLNETLSSKAIALLYIYNRYSTIYGFPSMKLPQRLALVAQLAKLSGGKFILAAEAVLPVINKNRADIAWMEERLGVDLLVSKFQNEPNGIGSEDDLISIALASAREFLNLLGIPASRRKLIGNEQNIKFLVEHIYSASLPMAGGCTQKIIKSYGNSLNGRSIDQVAINGLTSFRRIGLVGSIESCLISGWAIGANPYIPIHVKLEINGIVVAVALANHMIPDLVKRSIHPTGRCGFEFHLDPQVMLRCGDVITVLPSAQDFTLWNTPRKFND